MVTLPAHAYLDVPLDEADARAMVNRMGYGPTPAGLRAATGASPRQYLRSALKTPQYPAELNNRLTALPTLDSLWQRYGPISPYLSPKERQTLVPRNSALHETKRTLQQLAEQAMEIRLAQTVFSEDNAHEFLLNFWLGHFTPHGIRPEHAYLLEDYVRQIQAALAEDSFPALLQTVYFHPLFQLSQKTPERAASSLQAFTFGEALLDKMDVEALERILSGADVLARHTPETLRKSRGAEERGLFFLNPKKKLPTPSYFLGKPYPAHQGIGNMTRAMEQLSHHPATASFITRRLAETFYPSPVPEDLLKLMAQAFLRSGGKLSETLFPMLNSKLFHQSLAQAPLVRSLAERNLSVARVVCHSHPLLESRVLREAVREDKNTPFLSMYRASGAFVQTKLPSTEMKKDLAQRLVNAGCRPPSGTLNHLLGIPPGEGKDEQALRRLTSNRLQRR